MIRGTQSALPERHAMSDFAAKTDQHENAWTRDQALTLFKKYEDQGWAVKQQMLAIFGLLIPVVSGLIPYCVKNYFSKEAPEATTAAGWTAFFLSVFMAALIFISLLHANNDYTRSQKVLDDKKKHA
jgi:Na+/proline symporter